MDFDEGGGGGKETSAVLSRFTRPWSVHANNPRGACVHVRKGRGEKRREEGVVYARDSANEKFLSGSERFSL